VQSACPTARLMTSEIGGLGEGFRGEILDGFGLATPNAIRFHPMRVPEDRVSGDIGAIPLGFVREERPDVVVSYAVFSESIGNGLDSTIFTRYTYGALPASLSRSSGVWPAGSNLYVWVSKTGACAGPALDSQIRAALASN
jgi:hypothetical protein